MAKALTFIGIEVAVVAIVVVGAAVFVQVADGRLDIGF